MILETYASKTILHARALESMIRPGRLYFGKVRGRNVRFYVLGFAHPDGSTLMIREKGKIKNIRMDEIKNVRPDRFSAD